MNCTFRIPPSANFPALVLAAASIAGQPALSQTLAIRGGTLIDGNGGPPGGPGTPLPDLVVRFPE